jgi:HK97 family phage major capsid protein/HK97 family phage prohead protease
MGGMVEILDHTPQAVALPADLPLLEAHDAATPPVGRAEQLRLENGKLRGMIRFGTSARAQELLRDVKAGIVRALSIGYRVERHQRQQDGVYRAISWQPMEVSAVGVGADSQAGFFRNASPNSIKENTMTTDSNITLAGDSLAAVRADRERAASILDLATRHNRRDLGERAIHDGTPLDQFRGLLLDNVATSAVRDSAPDLDLSQRERQQFSIRRAILAQLDGAQYARTAGLELEASRALAAKFGRDPRGVFIPREVFQRDLSVGTNSAGGFMRPTDHLGSEFISPALNTPVIQQAGARVLSGLQGNVAIPKMTAGSTVGWVSAEGSALSETNPTFGQLTLSPKDLGCYVDVTRRLMQQSDPSIEQVIRDDFAAQLANGIDTAVFHGTGTSGQPTGIINSSPNSVAIGTNGGAPTYALLTNMVRENAIDNLLDTTSTWFINSRTMAKLMVTPRQSSGVEGNFIIPPDASASDLRMLGYRAFVSNNLASNLTKGSGSSLSAAFFGRPSDVIIGQWGGVEVLVDPYTAVTTGTVRLRVFQTVDVGIRYASSWCVASDISTT